MSLKRRQFLILGGLALGSGSSFLIQRRFNRTPVNQTLSDSVAIAANTQPLTDAIADTSSSHPAPAGMYAPQRGDVRLVVISDLNSRYGSTSYRASVEKAVQMIPDWRPDLVICGGDMIAGQRASLSRADIQAMWSAFDQQVFTSIRRAGLPFVHTLGNHDASSSFSQGRYVYAQEREEAQAFWKQPQRDLGITFVDPSGYPFYYSFEQNGIFYLVWDASSANVSEEQISWADRSLASDIAQNARLRIALGHLPFYAIAQGRDRAGEILNQADELRSLLERHRVHTYISGHHHAYFPGHVGKLQLLNCGALGNGPRRWLGSANTPIHTLTVVDIDLNALSSMYTTYNMDTLQVVDENRLPQQIMGPSGRVLRRDISWDALPPTEQHQQHTPSPS
ncbi:MAG: metallophosphoesterase [Leptolyngbyaceae cyanobacterium MO_188.B28]|nr:metallophosphoesterase [Leptolyngbyaceae cyanobacterium MO_188.B28]